MVSVDTSGVSEDLFIEQKATEDKLVPTTKMRLIAISQKLLTNHYTTEMGVFQGYYGIRFV